MMKVSSLLCGGLLLAAALFAALVAASSLFVDGKKIYDDRAPYYRFLMNTLVRIILCFCRVRLRVTGLETLPQDSCFLLVCNHISALDPIVTLYALRSRRLAFVAKEEVLRIPVIGKLLRRCCTLAIDRENPRNAMKTITKAAELIKLAGISVGIYPEGTRSRTGELLPFHNGVFKIALNAGAPVVVAVIRGSERVRKRAPFRSTDVTLTFTDVIPAAVVAQTRRTDTLAALARSSMLRAESGETLEKE